MPSCGLFFAGSSWKKYFLRVIPTLAYSPNIVSDRPSGISSRILSDILFWHSIAAFYLASYLASFLASTRACSLAFYLAFILTFYLASILTFFLTSILAFCLTFMTFFLAYVSGISYDILSGILSGISSEILCGWGPAGNTLIRSFRWRSGGEQLAEVRRETLRSRACNWGPAEEEEGRKAAGQLT